MLVAGKQWAVRVARGESSHPSNPALSHTVSVKLVKITPPPPPLLLLFNHYNASKDNWTSQWRRSIWAKWSLHINYSLELAPSRVNTIITRLKCGNSDTFIRNTRIHEIHRLIPLCYSTHRKFGLWFVIGWFHSILQSLDGVNSHRAGDEHIASPPPLQHLLLFCLSDNLSGI